MRYNKNDLLEFTVFYQEHQGHFSREITFITKVNFIIEKSIDVDHNLQMLDDIDYTHRAELEILNCKGIRDRIKKPSLLFCKHKPQFVCSDSKADEYTLISDIKKSDMIELVI